MQKVADLLQRPRWTSQSPIPFGRLVAVMDLRSAFNLLEQQISGSLQDMGGAAVSRDFPPSDPYRASPENSISVLIPSGTLVPGVRHDFRFEQFAQELETYLTYCANTAAKTLASFVGRVESLIGDSASVLLINEQTGERLESRCDTEVLRENGIGAGDEFRCEVVRCKGTTSTRLSRIPPKPLSKERVEQIRASFKDRWTF